jgi:hypothetical protein
MGSPNPNIKIEIWHPAVGLRCYIPPIHLRQLSARAMSLVKTPSGKELCRTSVIFMGYVKGPTSNPNIKVDILQSAVGLRCIIPPRYLRQLKARAIPLIATPSGKELCRSVVICHGICIGSPVQIQISKLIFNTLLWVWGVLLNLGT